MSVRGYLARRCLFLDHGIYPDILNLARTRTSIHSKPELEPEPKLGYLEMQQFRIQIHSECPKIWFTMSKDFTKSRKMILTVFFGFSKTGEPMVQLTDLSGFFAYEEEHHLAP